MAKCGIQPIVPGSTPSGMALLRLHAIRPKATVLAQLHVDAFGYRQSIFDFNPEIAHGAVEFGVAQRACAIKLHFLRH